jgi:hypothetical protein
MQQLLSQPRFIEHLDSSALLDAIGPALRDRGLDNDRDIYRTCLSLLRRLCAVAPATVPLFLDASHASALLPALSRLVSLKVKEDAIQQEVQCFVLVQGVSG